MADAAKLGEVAVARMCHDLAGPASALINGADLLQMEDGGFAAEALGLLRASARSLAARLNFFRATFGTPTARALKSAVDARATADAYVDQLCDRSRTFVLEAFPAGEDWPPERLRLFLLLVLIGADALPFGGAVTVEAGTDGVRLRARGRRAGFTEAVDSGFADGAADDPRAVAAALVAVLAAEAGSTARPWREADACGVDIFPMGLEKH